MCRCLSLNMWLSIISQVVVALGLALSFNFDLKQLGES